MDFYQIKEREGSEKKSILEVYPDYRIMRSKDLMIRAKSFYAIWDEEAGLWSTDEFDVQRLVDQDLANYEVKTPGIFDIHRKYLGNFSSGSWLRFRNYINSLSDNHKELDSSLTFRNTEVRKEDYVSKRLSYDLVFGDTSAWDELVGTLYSPEEKAKIEWAIGAIVTGDSKSIQKFLVFYGSAGTGKSTVMNIINWLFEDYVSTFVAKELVGTNNAFALESFKDNPLVAIEHDGDLSKVQDNSKLNSLVSHEYMQINEKFKSPYTSRFNAMLMIGTNKPVKITDSKSGLIRRLIDIHPTGNLVSARKYQTLMNQIKFELGAIAHKCRDVYLDMGKDYYSGYKPIEMMLQTDIFYNFIEAHFDIFKAQNGVSLNQAFELYRQFIKESDIEFSLPRYKLRGELGNYFDSFEERALVNGERVRSWFSGFNADRFKAPTGKKESSFSLVMEETESIFDTQFADCPAQYSKEDGTPRKYWTGDIRVNSKGEEFTPKPSQVVDTVLSDISTGEEHYVKVPEFHIVIDFDLTDAEGNKSAERNLEAASMWPPTYAEFSKSGAGIHLHYNWVGGTVADLERVYDDGIEVKVFTGNSSLRRKLSFCNNVPIADLSAGLPIKEKKVMNEEQIKSERSLRDLIERNLRKEIHPGTAPSVSFIQHILNEAHKNGLKYDVTDMRGRILSFAAKSSNQSLTCIKMVQNMKFASEETSEEVKQDDPLDNRIVDFDVEVYPNLFVICWSYEDSDNVVKMINPSAQEVENLIRMKLVGFNCRRYDNHILYAASMGYTNEQLYNLSQKIISGDRDAYFGEAYDLSYADIYEYAATKMSLKKWQVELGINHIEMDIPWDQPVPKELIPKVVDYCCNDVISTRKVREHLKQDFNARLILSKISGLNVNATTQRHTAKIIFGDDRKANDQFVYTDLSEKFTGYSYDFGKSSYRGEDPSEGGYVYAEPGMYENVAVLDVASMHPTSIVELNLFGEYTPRFKELMDARLAIKHNKFEEAKKMFGGALAPYLGSKEEAKQLSYALKIVINIVYGLTSAKFDNPFRDIRNKDNIVAKRGALFMIDLKHMVQEEGFTVAHIKTDSIKIPNATPEIIQKVMEFGEWYGYSFEHEETFEKFCLVNDAVYIAKIGWTPDGFGVGSWEAVGAQFQHPVVYKTLFSKEEVGFDDYCETKSVTTALYLDYTGVETPMVFESDGDKIFIGKVGRFLPIQEGKGGGYLVREKDGKFYAASGSKGYFWMEAERVKSLELEEYIDKEYSAGLVRAAVNNIKRFGDFDWLVN